VIVACSAYRSDRSAVRTICGRLSRISYRWTWASGFASASTGSDRHRVADGRSVRGRSEAAAHAHRGAD
jgi:hypothetical protein